MAESLRSVTRDIRNGTLLNRPFDPPPGTLFNRRLHKQYHLEYNAAKDLIQGALRTYAELGGKKLKEVFIHSRSDINKDEFLGYKEGCSPGIRVVGIRVKKEFYGLRLFREGAWPVIRGTFLEISDRSGYLWASGFKPDLRTYDGWELPIPLRIDIQHSEGDILQVATDIFALTKLNYNACKLGDSQPVTIRYSDAVGEILVSNPTVSGRKPLFKFYI